MVAPSPAAIPPGLPPALAPAPPFAIDRASEESKPILPPRPTGGHKAVAPQGWFGRNWPIVVIVLASLAIIGAVVLMMLPPSDPATGKSRSGAPGPAPDRMNTDPLVPRSGPHSNITPTPPPPDIDDPWATPRPPSPPPPPDPYADPDISDPFAQGGIVDPNDPLANNPFRMGGSSTLMFAMLGKMCERAKACPTDPAWDAACSMVAQVPRRPLPANCPSAQRCIDALDKVDLCGTDPSALTSMMLSASECMQAMTSC